MCWKSVDDDAQVLHLRVELAPNQVPKKTDKLWVVGGQKEGDDAVYFWHDPEGEHILGFHSFDEADRLAYQLSCDNHEMAVGANLMDDLIEDVSPPAAMPFAAISQRLH